MEGGALTGMAILRPNRRYGLREIVLAELFLRSPEAALGRRLLAGLAHEVEGDYLIAHFARGTLEQRMLGRSGFWRVPGRGILFTVRALNPSPLDPLAAACWDLSLGDLEVF
jgi:hypothetical protein